METVRKPSIVWRNWVTVALLALWWIGKSIYAAVEGPIEGSFVAGQLKDSVAGYSFSRAMGDGLLLSLFGWGIVLAIAVIWVSYFVKRSRANKVPPVAVVLVLALVGGNGCMGPAEVEQFVDIGPNETAYVIPLEGASNAGQAKFDSVAFLEAKKVAAKRISLPLREMSTGRGWWNYQYIPTAKVIKVDRTPVTREWTSNIATGTKETDQSLHMQSLDSIPFHIGATITVSVAEEEASIFLYNFGGKGLHDVVDTNVRSYLLGELSNMFAGVTLADSMKNKSEYFQKSGKDATTYFKQKGITIDYFGIEGGLGYDNKAVQDSLDKKYIAENDKSVALNEQAAQIIRNEIAVSKATADATAAAKFAASKDALTVKTEMEAVLIRAQAMKIAAETWNGQLPTAVVPQGSAFLFGLDGATTSAPPPAHK